MKVCLPNHQADDDIISCFTLSVWHFQYYVKPFSPRASRSIILKVVVVLLVVVVVTLYKNWTLDGAFKLKVLTDGAFNRLLKPIFSIIIASSELERAVKNASHSFSACLHTKYENKYWDFQEYLNNLPLDWCNGYTTKYIN